MSEHLHQHHHTYQGTTAHAVVEEQSLESLPTKQSGPEMTPQEIESLIQKVEVIGAEIEAKQRQVDELKRSIQDHSEEYAINQGQASAHVLHLVNYSRQVISKKHSSLFSESPNQEIVMGILQETFNENPHLVGALRLFEKKDEKILRHTIGTAAVATLIGRSIGYNHDCLKALAKAAIMHDTGKYVDYINEVANIPRQLNEDEWRTIREHPSVSTELIDAMSKYESKKDMAFMKEAARRHHIHYDRTEGYPEGLEELTDHKISQCVSIITASDAYDTMKAGPDERAYKDPNPLNETAKVQFAISEVERCKGTHFNPHIADVLVGLHTRYESGASGSVPSDSAGYVFESDKYEVIPLRSMLQKAHPASVVHEDTTPIPSTAYMK